MEGLNIDKNPGKSGKSAEELGIKGYNIIDPRKGTSAQELGIMGQPVDFSIRGQPDANGITRVKRALTVPPRIGLVVNRGEYVIVDFRVVPDAQNNIGGSVLYEVDLKTYEEPKSVWG